MDLLSAVARDLESQGIPYAVVGGIALAAHGVARATLDVDVLIVSAQAPGSEMWANVRNASAHADVRRGDLYDPFRAVIRITKPGSAPVDVLVGRATWQRDVVARAKRTSLFGVEVPVVGAADLILLKLFAGGPQDLWDVQQLLATPSRDALVAEVESRVDELPTVCRAQWRKVK